MQHLTALAIIAYLATSASGHMTLGDLIPPYQGDSFHKDPLKAGQEFCKGYHKGATRGPPKELKPGVNKFNLAGEARHGGGSMQVSLSFDGAKTFKVLKSYVGGFPKENTNPPAYEFTVPEDTMAGPAIFSWTWINVLAGQPEFYQDCAPVVIAGSGKNKLEKKPDIFLANLNKDACKAEGIIVKYPGLDENDAVTYEKGPDFAKAVPATGPKCGDFAASAPPGSGPGSGPTPTPTPTSSAPPAVPTPTPTVGVVTAPDDDDAPDQKEYTVISGDTCNDISTKTGVPVDKLMQMNKIPAECRTLVVGQKLTLVKRSRIMVRLA